MKASARSRAKARARRAEPGRSAWKTQVHAICAACKKRQLCVRHHVVYEQHVRREGGDPWDQSNAMLLGAWCTCHADHHSGQARLPVSSIPQTALDFASRLLGTGRAEAYVARYYRTDDPRRAK